MNDGSTKIKQQIVDKIKSSTNILITVSRDPSVDDLSAMLGLTALLNKLDKHATAIFSGAIPPAITFLEPNKVIENTVDSLRDFIIALDKEKADHLRYKVEGDVVKIFITPYHTNITSSDLEFSQGDYNVELVLALGVTNQEHLDTALTAHGGVLQDVTIATFSAGEQASQLSGMDWNDKNASGLSEMVALISDVFKTDKPILDKQISTVLLTGIVSATDRFSNMRTTSRVMTTAAQLMAAGADQQLIAAKLQESHEINSLAINPMDIRLPEVPVVNEPVIPVTPVVPELVQPVEPVVEQSTLPSDNLVIQHGSDINTTTLPPSTIVPTEISLPQPESSTVVTSTLPPINSIQDSVSSIPPEVVAEPSFGGTLSATTDQAEEESKRELENQQNTTILSHSYMSPESSESTPINSAGQTEDNTMVDIFANDTPSSTVAPSDLNIGAMPIVQPPKLDMPLPPPLPDFSTLPPPPMTGYDIPAPMPTPNIQPQAVINPGQFRIPGQ